MSINNPWKTAFLCCSAILLGIALGPFAGKLTGGLHLFGGQPVAAQVAGAAPAAALAPDSPEAVYVCTPAYVGAFSNRIHVRCTVAATGGIFYFAVPTSDSKNAARTLSVMLTAKAMVKNLQIYYSATGDGSAYGCQTSDCRPITGIEMTP